MPTGFWWGKMMERDSLKDLRIDGMIILNLFLGWAGGDLRRGGEDGDKWRAVVRAVEWNLSCCVVIHGQEIMNFR